MIVILRGGAAGAKDRTSARAMDVVEGNIACRERRAEPFGIKAFTLKTPARRAEYHWKKLKADGERFFPVAPSVG